MGTFQYRNFGEPSHLHWNSFITQRLIFCYFLQIDTFHYAGILSKSQALDVFIEVLILGTSYPWTPRIKCAWGAPFMGRSSQSAIPQRCTYPQFQDFWACKLGLVWESPEWFPVQTLEQTTAQAKATKDPWPENPSLSLLFWTSLLHLKVLKPKLPSSSPQCLFWSQVDLARDRGLHTPHCGLGPGFLTSQAFVSSQVRIMGDILSCYPKVLLWLPCVLFIFI